MEINLKKYFIILGLLMAGAMYVHEHYGFQDALQLAKKYPDPERSPKIEYYVGMAYYLRSQYPESASAFETLLTDHATSYWAPKAMYRLGLVYSEQRQWQNARDVYTRYMEEHPQGEYIEKVNKKYEVIKFR